MNPMSDALKARRMASAKPSDMEQAPAAHGAHGKDHLETLVANLDDASKAKLKSLLDKDLGESSEEESDEIKPSDINGPAPVTDGEKQELSQEIDPSVVADAQNIFKGQEHALGTPDAPGSKLKGLGDRFKASMAKHLKK